MKFKEYEVPDDLLYTKDHEWARPSGSDILIIGITDFAAKTLNDVVYVSLPPAGRELKQFSNFGTVESIKAVSELYAPASGVVTRVNAELDMHPELINATPYGEGWLLELRASAFETEKGHLLDARSYVELLASAGT